MDKLRAILLELLDQGYTLDQAAQLGLQVQIVAALDSGRLNGPQIVGILATQARNGVIGRESAQELMDQLKGLAANAQRDTAVVTPTPRQQAGFEPLPTEPGTYDPRAGGGTAQTPQSGDSKFIDSTTEFVGNALKPGGGGFVDAQGRVHIVDPQTGKDRVFENVQGTDRYILSSGDVADFTPSERARLAQDADQFNRTQEEGRRQFDAKATRDQYNSDREYKAARDEFGKSYAFQQHKAEFDVWQGQESAKANASSSAQRQYEFDITQIENAYNADTNYALQRAGIAGNVESKIADLGQQQQERGRSILKEAPDFLARAYFSRGEVSPMKQVTQADLLNALNQEIMSAQAQLRGTIPAERAPRQFAVPSRPAVYAPGQFAPAPTPSTPAGGATPNYFTPAGGVNPAYVAAGGQWSPTPGFESSTGLAAGGTTNARYFMVGEQGPELITNPQRADVGVLNNAQTRAAVPGFAIGTDPYAGSSFGLRTDISQQEIQGLAQQNQPPAVRDVMAGRQPAPLRFGFSIPTAQMLSTLTDDELQALGTSLATQNVSLQDLLFGVGQRFNPQSQGRPKYLGSV